MKDKVLTYQKNCWNTYHSVVGLPEKYCFIDGKTVKVHVPVDIAIGKLMIVGAYPSAIFETIKKIKDIPVGDHSHPFSNEKYFDGSRIRTVESGRELDEYYLSKLGISRNDCWITNLVKVFLFKPGHINKYNEIRPDCTTIATRNQYRIFAIRSLEYFTKEVELAKPKIILTLGSEVTAAIHQCSEKKSLQRLKGGIEALEIHGNNYATIGLPHPGILMRNTAASLKWRNILDQQLNKIKSYLN